MDDALRTLAAAIIEELHLEEITPDDIDPDAPLFGEGLGLDSIDALELALIVRRRFNAPIADNDEGRRAFASLRALATFIDGKRG